MVAHIYGKGKHKVVSPTKTKKGKDGAPIPDEPHIGSVITPPGQDKTKKD